jgi:hypothetical protein
LYYLRLCSATAKDRIISLTIKLGLITFVEKYYGYAWVCLGEPLIGIPNISETTTYRQIHTSFMNVGIVPDCSDGNELDSSAPTLVHTSTFGSERAFGS